MLPDLLPAAASPDSASLAVAQALAADLTPIRAVRMSAQLRALAGAPPLSPAEMPQSSASTPPPPPSPLSAQI